MASGTTARSTTEWIGATPDQEPPTRVKLRILERQRGKCARTGRKFRPGDKKRLDHKIAAADQGENRESNLQWILDPEHKAKSKAEAAVRKVVRRKAKAHQGLKPPPQRPMESRNDLAAPKRDKDRLPPPSGPTEMQRRFSAKPPGERR